MNNQLLRLDFIQIVCPLLDQITNEQKVIIDDDFKPLVRKHLKHRMEDRKPVKVQQQRYMALERSENGGLVICLYGKILGHRYPELIGANNIEYALERALEVALNYHNCLFDVKHVMKYGKVTQLHVTEDVKIGIEKKAYRVMDGIVGQHKVWDSASSTNGRVWKNSLTGPENAVQLTGYQKGIQMDMTHNIAFMIENGIDTDTYVGTSRFELKLFRQAAIRKFLGIRSKEIFIDDVFNVSTSPLAGAMREIFDLNSKKDIKAGFTLAEEMMVLFLEKYGLEKDGGAEVINFRRAMEALRLRYSKNAARKERQFKEVYAKLMQEKGEDRVNGTTGAGIVSEVLEKIEERWKMLDISVKAAMGS